MLIYPPLLKVRPHGHRSSNFPLAPDHLAGPVVKASASRAEDPGLESRLIRDFFRGRVLPAT